MTTTRINRRQVAGGAAWALPVLAVAAAAPALAASATGIQGNNFVDYGVTSACGQNAYAPPPQVVVSSTSNGNCGFLPRPVTTSTWGYISNVVVTVWFSSSGLTFTNSSASGAAGGTWSNLVRDTTVSNMTSANGIVYYAYRTTYLGSATTPTMCCGPYFLDPNQPGSCGPTYSFSATNATTVTWGVMKTGPNNKCWLKGNYFQISATMNGTVVTNPVVTVGTV